VIALTGKGETIHVTALVRGVFNFNSNGPVVFDAAIDGGTFAYANATGCVHLVRLSDGDIQQTFLIN